MSAMGQKRASQVNNHSHTLDPDPGASLIRLAVSNEVIREIYHSLTESF
jgi:hypothetical protein